MRKGLSITLAVLVVVLAWTVQARAALNLACEPPIIRREILPGESISFSMNVLNTGDVPCDVTAEVEDLKLTLTGTNVYVPSSASDPWGASGMITLSPAEFTLQPGETKGVSVKVKAPRDLRGGRYAAIFFKGVQSGVKGPIILAIRPGSLLFLTVKGSEKPQAVIGDIYLASSGDGGRPKICATLKNEGNVHITASGKAGLFKSTGETVTNIDFTPGGGTILPGGERVFESMLPEDLPDEEYTLVVTFTYAGKTERLKRTLVVSGQTCVVR